MIEIKRNDHVAVIDIDQIEQIDLAGPPNAMSGPQTCRIWLRSGRQMNVNRIEAEQIIAAKEAKEKLYGKSNQDS